MEDIGIDHGEKLYQKFALSVNKHELKTWRKRKNQKEQNPFFYHQKEFDRIFHHLIKFSVI